MRFFVIIIFTWFFTTPSLYAQQISIEEFGKVKHPFWQKSDEKRDKQNAILKLTTNEGEFKFSMGGVPLKAEAGEGVIVVTLPPKSNFMTVTHPTYGQLTWKAPAKELKRNKCYQANLSTSSPDKEYKISKQWSIFYINPSNVIIYIDSSMRHVNNGIAQYYLPMGRHSYRIVAPFYEDYTGVIEVSDTLRAEQRVNLVPLYSYLTINTNVSGAEIRLDGKLIGSTAARTGKIMQGEYLLTVTKPQYVTYSSIISVAAAERRIVDVTLNAAQTPNSSSSAVNSVQIEAQEVAPPTNSPLAPQIIKAPVTITAFDAQTQIMINRESVGKGEWNGTLDSGFYSISTTRDGLQSKSFYLWVENDKPIIVDMATPLDNYGILNISCNVVDAKISINGVVVGRTPCIIKNLIKDKSYIVRIEKSGYNSAEKRVYLRGNDMVDVDIKLVTR